MPLRAAGMVEVFKKLWPDDWGPRLEHLLRNVVFALLETPAMRPLGTFRGSSRTGTTESAATRVSQ